MPVGGFCPEIFKIHSLLGAVWTAMLMKEQNS